MVLKGCIFCIRMTVGEISPQYANSRPIYWFYGFRSSLDLGFRFLRQWLVAVIWWIDVKKAKQSLICNLQMETLDIGTVGYLRQPQTQCHHWTSTVEVCFPYQPSKRPTHLGFCWWVMFLHDSQLNFSRFP
jgi:hypothetical protein